MESLAIEILLQDVTEASSSQSPSDQTVPH